MIRSSNGLFSDIEDNTAIPTRETIMNRMQLDAVTKGRVKRPLKMVAYGPEGVGKSSFAAQAPDPIFLCAEDGTNELDVDRFPEPKQWADLFDAVHTLRDSEHGYRTLVVDTLDWIQSMLQRHVIIDNSMTEEKYEAYGRGDKFAIKYWKEFQAALDDLRAVRGMHVVLLAHSHTKTFKNPEGDDFDRYQLALPALADALWKQWPDSLLFLSWETLTKKADNGKAKGIIGDRVIYTERTAAFDAKNRYGLPPALPFPPGGGWKAFADAVKASRPQPTKDETKAA